MSIRLTSGRAVIAGLASVALLGACNSDRATVLEPIGSPIFNFRTLPAAAASQALPGGTVALSRPAAGTGTINITLRNLEPLNGAVYKVWLGDSAGTTFVPATAERLTYTVGSTDTTRAPGETTSPGFGVNERNIFRVTGGSLGSDPTAARFGTVLVTIETNAAATTPGDVRPLWARYALPAVATPPAAATASANLVFGNFAANSAEQYVFVAAGRGTAGVRDNAFFLDDTALSRPPRGYYYAAYGVQVDDELNPSDTLALGELKAPFPREGVSLRDADERLVDPVVTDRPMAIDAASIRFFRPSGNFMGFRDVFLVLKAKRAADQTLLPANRVLAGTLPAEFYEPEEEEETE